MKVEKMELPKRTIKLIWNSIKGEVQQVFSEDIVCDVIKGIFHLSIVCVDPINLTIAKAETEKQKIDVKEVKEALLDMLPFCERCGIIHMGYAWFIADGEIVGKVGSTIDVRDIAEKIVKLMEE